MELSRTFSVSADDIRVQLVTGNWLQAPASGYDEHGITLQDEEEDEMIYLPWTSVAQLRFAPKGPSDSSGVVFV